MISTHSGDLIMPWSSKEIAYVVEEYFASQRSVVTAQRKFRQQFRKQKTLSREVMLPISDRQTMPARENSQVDLKHLVVPIRAMRHRALEYFHRDGDLFKDVIFKS